MENATAEKPGKSLVVTTLGTILVAALTAFASFGTAIENSHSRDAAQRELESYQQQQRKISACQGVGLALGQAIAQIDLVMLKSAAAKPRVTTAISKVEGAEASASPLGVRINSDVQSRLTDIDNILGEPTPDIGALTDRRNHLEDDLNNLCKY
jgi:hypothetical protein